MLDTFPATRFSHRFCVSTAWRAPEAVPGHLADGISNHPIQQGLLDCPFEGNQTIQIQDKLEGYSLITVPCLGWDFFNDPWHSKPMFFFWGGGGKN